MREAIARGLACAALWIGVSVAAALPPVPAASGRSRAVEASQEETAPAAPSPVHGTAPALLFPPELAGVRAERYGNLLVLRGEVVREADRELAEKIATANGGAGQVLNRIEVGNSVRQRIGPALRASLAQLQRLVARLPILLLGLAVVWLFWRAGRWLAERRWLARRPARNPFAAEVARQAVRAAVLLVGVLIALELLDATALAAALLGSAGVAGIALGFAFRDLLENYIAGVLLSLRQPFAPDDVVELEGREAVVVGMNSRATIFMTHDGNHLTMPNAVVFKATVQNFTRNGKRRFAFTLDVDPTVDVGAALREGLDAVRGTRGVLARPAAFGQLERVGRESLALTWMAWVDQRESSFGDVRSEAMRAVRARLIALGADFGPPRLRLLTPADGPAQASAAPEAERPPEDVPAPEADQAAVQEAVERTRAEMGASNLMQGGERE